MLAYKIWISSSIIEGLTYFMHCLLVCGLFAQSISYTIFSLLSLSLSCSFSFDLLLLSTRSCFSKKKQVATVEREVDGDLVTLCLDLPAVITRVHVHSIGFTCSYDWSYIYSLRSCQNSLVVAEARGKLYIGQLKTLEKRLMVWFPS